MATHLKKQGCTVYRDKEANNAKAIKLAYDQCIERFKKKKEHERAEKEKKEKERTMVAAENEK